MPIDRDCCDKSQFVEGCLSNNPENPTFDSGDSKLLCRQTRIEEAIQ